MGLVRWYEVRKVGIACSSHMAGVQFLCLGRIR